MAAGSVRAGGNELAPTKADLQAQLDEALDERDATGDLTLARLELHRLIRQDVGWIYAQARDLMEHGNACSGDQVRATMVKVLLDKIAPDLKSLQRGGGAAKAAAVVNIDTGGGDATISSQTGSDGGTRKAGS